MKWQRVFIFCPVNILNTIIWFLQSRQEPESLTETWISVTLVRNVNSCLLLVERIPRCNVISLSELRFQSGNLLSFLLKCTEEPESSGSTFLKHFYGSLPSIQFRNIRNIPVPSSVAWGSISHHTIWCWALTKHTFNLMKGLNSHIL